MVPGGILVYKFRYINQPSVPLRLQEVPELEAVRPPPRPRRGVVNSPARRLESEVHNLNFGEDDSSSRNSDMSESLLSLRTSPSPSSGSEGHEIDFEPPAPDPDPPVPLVAEVVELDQSHSDSIIIEDVRPAPELTSRINLNMNLGGGPQPSTSKRPIPQVNL